MYNTAGIFLYNINTPFKLGATCICNLPRTQKSKTLFKTYTLFYFKHLKTTFKAGFIDTYIDINNYIGYTQIKYA